MHSHIRSTELKSTELEKEAYAAHRNRAKTRPSRRTDQQWLDDLTGQNGTHVQETAHEDLANYLFRVAISYLDLRQESVSFLSVLSDVELTELAQDFVQETLEKIASNHFVLLSKYSGTGRFTSWMAQVIRNQIAGELRRATWQKRSVYDAADVLAGVAERSASPEQMAVAAQMGQLLRSSLEQLPEHYRIALWDRIVEGDSAEDVGGKLGISANAVNLLVFRGKAKLRTYLHEVGVDAEILSVFIDVRPVARTCMTDAS